MSVCNIVKKLEPLYTAMVNTMDFPQKIKNRTIM